MRGGIRGLLDRSKQRRTLGSYVARTLLPRTVVFGAASAALLVGNAMAVDPLASPANVTPDALPAWTAEVAAAHPDCVDAASWPQGRVADTVVAFSFQAQSESEVAFDRAWAQNHNATASDDLWVLGVCP